MQMRFDTNPTHGYPFAYMTESDPRLGNRVMWQFHKSRNYDSGNVILQSMRHSRMHFVDSDVGGYQLVMKNQGGRDDLVGDARPSQSD